MNGATRTVYGLVSSAEPNRIRYVGCTDRPVIERVYEHRGDRFGNISVNRWVKECMERGEVISAVVLQECADFSDEVAHIARLRAEGSGLLNETDGGMGSRGRPLTEAEWRARQQPATEKSKAITRELHRTQPDVMLRGLLAASADPATRAQRSERMTARNSSLSAEQKAAEMAKMLATRAERTPEQNAETLQKSQAARAAWTPEQRAENSRRQSQGLTADPEKSILRADRIKAALGRRTPEQKAATRAKTQATNASKSPEDQAETYRKRSDAQRAAGADPALRATRSANTKAFRTRGRVKNASTE